MINIRGNKTFAYLLGFKSVNKNQYRKRYEL